MANANTLFFTAFQLAMGLGIALGAIAWRIGEAVTGPTDPALPFRAAFLIVAAFAVAGVLDSLKLRHSTGDHVARGTQAKEA